MLLSCTYKGLKREKFSLTNLANSNSQIINRDQVLAESSGAREHIPSLPLNSSNSG